MKKLMIFVFAVMLALGTFGTAMAQTTVELNFPTNASGVSRVYWSPVFGTATGGASAFVVGGTILNEATGIINGTTLYAVSNTISNAAGTELATQALYFDSGATPIGGPQLVSGTSDTVILFVNGPTTGTVGNGPHSGGTLYSINGGTGAVYWTRPIAASGFQPTGGVQDGSIFAGVDSGGTPFSTAPVTIDTESYTDELGGATIFGVSGGSVFGTIGGDANTAGVSIWAINANTGAYATTPSGLSNVTAFAGNDSSGVSVVHAAPLVSGDSLFIVGYSFQGNGNTIYQFQKNNLLAGVSAFATVGLEADLSDQWVTTPTVAGNSIFVVDNNGSVTSYYKANLTQNYNVDYTGTEAVAGVTASPVTNGNYIVLCSTSSVSAYLLDNLSQAATSSAAEWGYNFAGNFTIDATPAISGDYVWVTVNDRTNTTSATYRFTLNSTDGDIQTVATYGNLTYASPAIVQENIWTVSYNPSVQKLTDGGARGVEYWPQFKFDAAKTGHNTAPSVTVVTDDDDFLGCFISTIK